MKIHITFIPTKLGASTYECSWNEWTHEAEPFYADARFSAGVLFLITFLISLLGAISFILVAYFPRLFKEKEEQVDTIKTNQIEATQEAQPESQLTTLKASCVVAFSRRIDDFALLACYGILMAVQNTVLMSIQVGLTKKRTLAARLENIGIIFRATHRFHSPRQRFFGP